MNRRGSVPLLVAGLAVGMIGGMGVAVDTTRAWLVEVRLKSAIDAAGLTAARLLTEPNRDAAATAVFWANLTQDGRPSTYLGATIGNPVIATEPTNPGRVRVTATATVPTTIFSVLRQDSFTFTSTSVAQRSGRGLELAIVFDTSQSMSELVSGGGTTTKLDAARNAAKTMLGILYGGADLAEGMFVSVVPFSTNINIGTGNTAMLNSAAVGTMPALPASWSTTRWAGCVETRDREGTPTDDAPTGDRRFRPYFWPSTFQQVGTVGSNRCSTANAYSGANNNSRFCHGDNDWLSGTTLRNNTAISGNEMYRLLTTTRGFLQADGTDARARDPRTGAGPNLLCNPTPLLPLTARRSAVEAHLDTITAPRATGGTVVSVGLEGAWYTLSPNWRTRWQETNTGVPNLPPLPRDYNQVNSRKAVVILTDGDNNWLEAQGPSSGGLNWFGSGGCTTGSSRGVCSSATNNELLYTAYGRARAAGGWNTRFPSATISDANAVFPNSGTTGPDGRLDSRMSAYCTAMKAQGILIYVIGFEVQSSTHRTLLQNCSSGAASYYFESPSAATLNTVFSQIAAQLASLSLAE